jgi:hypothetical protein
LQLALAGENLLVKVCLQGVQILEEGMNGIDGAASDAQRTRQEARHAEKQTQ